MNAALKRSAVVAAFVAAVSLLWPGSGSAQIPLPLPSSSPTPTTSPSPSPTKTSSPKPKPSESTSTTPQPDDDDRATRRKKKKAEKAETDPVVAKGLRAWLERKRTPARTTTRLLELIDRTEPGAKEPSLAQKRARFGRFPVVGYVWYQDDYGAPRYFPYYHPHEGTDLFAKSGTPVMAVSDGVIVKTASGGGGGNAVWLRSPDDVRYYYGHLKSIARGIKPGVRVRQGDLLGRVGATGDSAKGTYPHVHFEINPGGRGTINPKPLLDGWLDAAEAAAVDQLGSLRARNALAPLGAARWDLLTEVFAEPVAQPPAFWAFGLDGSGASVAFADMALRRTLQDQIAGVAAAPAGADGSLAASFLHPVESLAGFAHTD